MAFHHLRLTKDSQKWASFVVNNGEKYSFTRMGFGIKNSPSLLSKALIDTLNLDPSLNEYVSAYLDDLLCFHHTLPGLLLVVERLFKLLRRVGFLLNVSKCVFLEPTITFVGHTFSSAGVRPQSTKLAALMNIPRPHSKKQLRSIIGMLNYFRSFIVRYVHPLVQLLL